MKPVYVTTSNTLRFTEAFSRLVDRGAREACFMVVDGLPGLSKTHTAEWWAVQNQMLLVRSTQKWTPGWVLNEILRGLGKTPEHSFQKCYKQTIEALSARNLRSIQDGKPFAIVVDEAEYFSRERIVLETFRDLSDTTAVPIILIGMMRIRNNLARFKQVSSRVGQYVEFIPNTLQDTAKMIRGDAAMKVEGLSEVEIADDMVEFMHRRTNGFSRELIEAIKAVERFGKRQPGKPVSLSAMDGQSLFNSREDGKPVIVRA